MLPSLDLWPAPERLAFLFAIAGLASALLIVLLHPLLKRYTLARPNARSSHRDPTPQGGGIAVIGAILVTMAAGAALAPGLVAEWPRLAVVLAAAVGLAVVGAVDDIHPLAPALRLTIQAIAVVAVVAILPPNLRAVTFMPWWIERILLALALLWFVNLVNFMDGIDWMTVAEVVPLSAGLLLFGLAGALPHDATLVALALCGATIGFAPFNRPVARLFLGDVGSLPIGLLLGWLLFLLADGGHLAAALLLPLYYGADATLTLLRRLLAGEPVWMAHRRHFYQRAFDGGLSVFGIVARVFAVNLLLVALAAMTFATGSFMANLGLLAAGALLVGVLLWDFSRRAPKA